MEIFPLLRKFVPYFVQAYFISYIFGKKFAVRIVLSKVRRNSKTNKQQNEETVERNSISAQLLGPAKKQPSNDALHAPLKVTGAEGAN